MIDPRRPDGASDDETWASIDPAEQEVISRWLLETVDADIEDSIERSPFGSDPDRHAGRKDRRGVPSWEALGRVHTEALEESMAIERAAAERRADSGEEGIATLAAIVCSELPTRRRVKKDD